MFGILAKISFFMSTIMVIWITICVILSLIILVQKGKGGGLSGAFGGAGTGGGLLGTKTGDFLTWVTISLVGLFFLLAIVIGIFLTTGDTPATEGVTIPQTQVPTGGDAAATQEEATPVTGAETQEEATPVTGAETKEAATPVTGAETKEAAQPTEPKIPAGNTENTDSDAETDTPK